MLKFADELEKEIKSQKTLTDNGGVAYQSSGKELIDFNFSITSLRYMTTEEVQKRFARVYFEDKKLAVKYIFYIGDIRQGLGERKIFRDCIAWLMANENHLMVVELLKEIPEYNRWDSLIRLIQNKYFSEEILLYIVRQINNDYDNMQKGNPISLVGKWLPSENASSKATKRLARLIIKKLQVTPKQYRKMLSELRKYIDVVETKMSANEWEKIDFSKVPSKASMIYREAFLRHTPEEYEKFITDVKNGNKKINASVLTPPDIVHKYVDNDFIMWSDSDEVNYVKEFDDTLEVLWSNLPNKVVKNSIVVRDGSASMTWGNGIRPLDVATALAIYISEHTTESFKNKFITFSKYAQLIDLEGLHTLHEKLKKIYTYDDCENTDIQNVMKLILDTAVKNNLSQEEIPENIIIISDMQFDPNHTYSWGSSNFGWDKTVFENVSDEYKTYGYKLPKIIFWNVDTENRKTVPIQENELGLILISGYSTNLVDMVMSGDIDPYKALVNVLNSERYAKIDNVFNKYS